MKQGLICIFKYPELYSPGGGFSPEAENLNCLSKRIRLHLGRNGDVIGCVERAAEASVCGWVLLMTSEVPDAWSVPGGDAGA